MPLKNEERNIVLFIGDISAKYIRTINKIEKDTRDKFRIAVITEKDGYFSYENEDGMRKVDYVIKCDVTSEKNIREELEKIKNNIFSICFYAEKYGDLYYKVSRIIKLKNSTPAAAIEKCTDKVKMRNAFYKYDPKITPKFILVKNRNYIDVVNEKIGYPCMLKPAHLSKSRLITVSHDINDLRNNIDHIFGEIKKVYEKIGVKTKPKILAEEMMEGKMYTSGIYVDKDQKIYFTPLVRIITARDVGMEDFHLYARIVPSGLTQAETKKAFNVVRKGAKALGLKNTTAHCELMRLDDGSWKIIEVGARIGGYRYRMFKNAYGFDHIENDLRIRLGKKPIIRHRLKYYFAAIEFFPKEDGIIESIEGLNGVKKLPSFRRMIVDKKVGDCAGLAKSGHTSVVNVFLRNESEKKINDDLKEIKNIIRIGMKS